MGVRKARSKAAGGMIRRQHEILRRMAPKVLTGRLCDSEIRMLVRLRSELTVHAEEGCAEAQLYLGWMHAVGAGGKIDCDRAQYWYGKAAEGGDPRAEYDIGRAFDEGTGRPKDRAAALVWYARAAAKGYPFALYSLGVAYAFGEGVRKSRSKGLRLLYDAYYNAKQENPAEFAELVSWAAVEMGCIYDYEEPLQPERAVKWYRRAARRGSAKAMLYLGVHYELGDGVRRDERRAREWFQRAARLGNVEAGDRLRKLAGR